jgi:hypothetical protein
MQGFRNGNIPVASGKVIRLSEKQQFDSKSTVTFQLATGLQNRT